MDFAEVIKSVCDLFIYMCSLEFTFAGYTTTVGAVLIWSALAVLVIGIIKGMVG